MAWNELLIDKNIGYILGLKVFVGEQWIKKIMWAGDKISEVHLPV